MVKTDASNYAIGAVISQLGKDGELRPLAFMSHQIDSAQLNYPVHNKEFLATKRAFQEWQHYLKGAVHNDNCAHGSPRIGRIRDHKTAHQTAGL